MKSILPCFTAIVCTLILIAESGCSADAKKARHLAAADKFYSEGKYGEAEIEYKNVLSIDGRNGRAIAQLSLLYIDQGRNGVGLASLLRAKQIEPDNIEIHRKLGVTALSYGDLANARSEAIFVLGRNPKDAEATLLLEQSSVEQKEAVDAKRLIQELPGGAADGAAALVALGNFELRKRDYKAAEALFRRAEAAEPKSVHVQSALGTLFWRQGDLNSADTYLKKASETSAPRSPQRMAYVQFKIRTGDIAAGRKSLAEIRKNTPDYIPALILEAELSAAEKSYDAAKEIVKKGLVLDPLNLDLGILDTQILLAKAEPAKAITELENLVKIYPLSAKTHYQLGLSHLANQQMSNAIGSLNQAIAIAPNYADAILLLAELNVRRGDTALAVNALRKILQSRPDLVPAWLLLASAYRQQNNLENALAIYRQLAQASPTSAELQFLIGSVLAQQGKRPDARLAFNKTLELAPDKVLAQEQLAGLDAKERKSASAIDRIEKRMAVAGVSADEKSKLQIILARLHLAQNEPDKAEAAMQKSIQFQPDSPAGYLLLAQFYVQTKRQDKAVSNLEQALEKNPRNTEALMLIAALSEQQKAYPAAAAYYERLLAINGKLVPALNNYAWIAAEYLGQADKAYDLAKRARELAPTEPSVTDTLGWVLFKRRQYSAALTLLTDSAERLPESADAQFHVGMAYYMMGEEKGAREGLNRALKLNQDLANAGEARKRLDSIAFDPATTANARATLERQVEGDKDDPVAAAKLAWIYQREGSLDKAFALYNAVLKANPNNATAALGVATVYAARKDTAKAIEWAKTARKLSPTSPEVAHQLGQLAYSTGDYSWSTSLLQEASRNMSDNPEVLFDLAEASYANGQVAIAESSMRAALAKSNFSRAVPARQFLEFLPLANGPVAAGTAARVEEALRANANYVPALMARANIYKQSANSQQAIETYEAVLNAFPDFTNAQRELLLLDSEKPSNDQKAYELGLKARAAFPNDADVAKAFGIVLFRRGDHTRAANLLLEASRSRQNDPDVLYYLGMAQHELKQATQSKNSLQRALATGTLRPEFASAAQKILSANK